jgi:hypothetical protein
MKRIGLMILLLAGGWNSCLWGQGDENGYWQKYRTTTDCQSFISSAQNSNAYFITGNADFHYGNLISIPKGEHGEMLGDGYLDSMYINYSYGVLKGFRIEGNLVQEDINVSILSSCNSAYPFRGNVNTRCPDSYNGASLRIEVYPPPAITRQSETILLKNRQLKVTIVPDFFPATCKWQYSTEYPYEWRDVPYYYFTDYQLIATGENILGNSFKDMIGKNIYLSVDYGTCGRSKILVIPVKDSAPFIASVTSADALCAGESSGSITVTMDRALYNGEELEVYYEKQINWNHAISVPELIWHDSVTFQIPNLEKDVYYVRIASRLNGDYTDDSNIDPGPYHDEFDISINEPDNISYQSPVILTHISCHAGNDGSLSIPVSGGLGGYVLHYCREGDVDTLHIPFPSSSPGQIMLSGLYAGTYHYYVTDQNGCTRKSEFGEPEWQEVILMQPENPLSINNLTITELSGFGKSNGSISLDISGGSPGYVIVCTRDGQAFYSGNDNPLSLDAVPAGHYAITVTDSKGCTTEADTTVSQPPLLTASLEVQQAVSCNGETDGALVVHAIGGVPHPFGKPYTYSWYRWDGSRYAALSGRTDSILSNLGRGDYSVRITDANMNDTALFYALPEPDSLLASVTAWRDIACYGINDAQVQVTLSGGNGHYTLSYKREDSEDDYTQLTLNQPDRVFSINSLSKGVYLLSAVDGNGCIASFSGEWIERVTVQGPDTSLHISSVSLKPPTGYGRSDGRLSVKIAGGTPFETAPAYQIIWKNDRNKTLTASELIDGGGLFASTIENLPEGEYTVEVRDKNSCYYTYTYSVTAPDLLTVALENTASIRCHGDAGGAIAAHVSGGVKAQQAGVLPYHYRWFSVEGGIETLIPNQADSILAGLPAGNYRVKITDGSDPANETESAVFLIGQPEQLATSLISGNISCYGGNDGLIRVKTGGGVAPYRMFYRTNDNENYTEHPVNSADSTFYLQDLYAGNHAIYITDDNQCLAPVAGSDTAVVMLTQPDAPLAIASVIQTDASGFGRFDGSIALSLTGGTPFDNGSYTVEWRDGSNQLLPSASATLDNQLAGAYSVHITDKNACTVSASYTLTEPEKLAGSITETHIVTCFGDSDGQLTAHVQGGVRNRDAEALPYLYRWSRKEEGNYLPVSDADSILHSISAGDYRVVVEDYSRVVNRDTLYYILTQPDSLQTSATRDTVFCGGTTNISVTVSGGITPYRYVWTTGDTTPEVLSVGAGNYGVTVYDARNCLATDIALVYTPADLAITGTVTHPVCYGDSNGNIHLQVSGGEAPYRYRWSNGATVKDPDSLPAGTYTVEVTDINDCSLSTWFVLTDPEPVSVFIGEDRTLCIGQSLTLSPQVSDLQTRFAWTGPENFRETGSEITVYDAGFYRLVTTDSKNCIATDSLLVSRRDLDISSEIVVASHIFAGDTILIVNISDPEPEPARSEWLIEASDSVETVELHEHYAKVIFAKAGHYTVGYRTYVEECYQDDIHSLTVVEPGERDSAAFGESIIEKFVIYPNPNSGSFTVDIELSKASPVRLRMFDLSKGLVVNDRRESGEDRYSLPYGLSLPPGVYALLLETPSGSMNVKMIVK